MRCLLLVHETPHKHLVATKQNANQLTSLLCIFTCVGDIDDPSGLLPSDLVLSPGSSVASNSSGDKNKSKSKTNKVT